MSGFFDEAIIFGIADTISTTIEAVKAGAALFSSAANKMKTVMVNPAQRIAEYTKDLKIIKNEQNKIIKDTERVAREAFLSFENKVLEDPNFISDTNLKLIEKLDLKAIELDKEYFKDFDLKEKESYNLLINLSNFIYYKEQLENLFYLASEQNLKIDIEEEFYQISNDLKELLKSKNINKINNRIMKLSHIFNDSIKLVNEEIAISGFKPVERLSEVLFNMENKIGVKHHYIFENELINLLEEDEKIKEEKLLFEINKYKNEMILKINEVFSLGNISNEEEIDNLIKSFFNFLNDEEISNETKLSEIEQRYKILNHEYIKLKKENESILKYKNQFDVYFSEIVYIQNYLGETKMEYNFDYNNNLESQVENLKLIHNLYAEKYLNKQNSEFVKKAVRETMMELKFAHIASDDTNNSSRDIYHLDSGNVVTISYSNKGNIRYLVSGVEMDGITSNKEQIVETMENFCDVKDLIDQKLSEKGITKVRTNERLKPAIYYAEDIKLPDNVSACSYNVIRNAKLKRREQGTKKERYIK